MSVPEILPGPVIFFPLRAREGGVLTRAGHTEAAVDLARMADCYPPLVRSAKSLTTTAP